MLCACQELLRADCTADWPKCFRLAPLRRSRYRYYVPTASASQHPPASTILATLPAACLGVQRCYTSRNLRARAAVIPRFVILTELVVLVLVAAAVPSLAGSMAPLSVAPSATAKCHATPAAKTANFSNRVLLQRVVLTEATRHPQAFQSVAMSAHAQLSSEDLF